MLIDTIYTSEQPEQAPDTHLSINLCIKTRVLNLAILLEEIPQTVSGRCKWVIPEFICGEDDPSLQQKRSKHPQKQTQAQRGKQTLEIHMLQTGI